MVQRSCRKFKSSWWPPWTSARAVLLQSKKQKIGINQSQCCFQSSFPELHVAGMEQDERSLQLLLKQQSSLCALVTLPPGNPRGIFPRHHLWDNILFEKPFYHILLCSAADKREYFLEQSRLTPLPPVLLKFTLNHVGNSSWEILPRYSLEQGKCLKLLFYRPTMPKGTPSWKTGGEFWRKNPPELLRLPIRGDPTAPEWKQGDPRTPERFGLEGT